MTDPWTLHRNLACPSCHVVGKVVQTEDYDPDPPFICVECGSSWHDGGVYADQSLKECRIQYGRLIEGRPYEPPKREEPKWGPSPLAGLATVKYYEGW